MIDLTHYTVEAKGSWSVDGAYLEAGCDRCPGWYLPGPDRAELPMSDLVGLLQDHEREAHP